MRQKLSLLTKTMLLLGALVAGSSAMGQAPANTVLWSEDFSGYSASDVPSGSITNSHTGTTVYGGVTLTYACEQSGTKVYDSGGPDGSNNLLIASKNGTFSVSGISTGGATELTISYDKTGQGTLAISSSTTGVDIDGSTIKTNGASTLQLTFKNTNTSTKNLRIDNIEVTVKTAAASNAVATTVTINSTGITNTDVKKGTEAGTLTATVAAGETTIEGATVTWSSNNTAVATVGETTGVVTLVTAGTAKITASYAGVTDTYKESSADYTLTVTDSRTVPTLTFDPATLPTLATDDEDLTLTLTTDYDGTVTATSSDASKATITATGTPNQWTISPKAAGNVTFTFSGDATANYKAANATLSLTVATGTSLKLNKTVVVSNWTPVSGSYYTTATDVTIDGVKFNLYQCCKQTDLQLKSGSGVLTSPIIKSENGYTVILTTGSGSTASGELTLQIGSEEAVTVSGADNTVLATTSSKSASFTVKNLSSKMMRITKIVIMPNIYVTSNGWATYITPTAMEFAAETAYIVTAVDEDAGTITIDDVTAVPANTPLLVKGEGVKTVSVPATTEYDPATNLLTICTGSAPDQGYYYVLDKDGDGAGFKQWTGDASTLKDRVVLVLSQPQSGGGGARMLRFVESDTQGIGAALMNKETMNNVVYDLQGRSVAQPTKGLYIVNGKKVIMR